MKYLSLPFILLLGLLSACGPTIVYEESTTFAEPGWSYTDSLVAEFAIADTNQIYNLHLRLTHGLDFPYQNFYVQVHTVFPQGERISQQVSLELARSSGSWFGDCNSEQCVLDIPIQEGAYFNQAGTYRIVVEQFSRENPLAEVYALGFALEETDAKREGE
jgi:gliding motility-associated lipoprotein GldH